MYIQCAQTRQESKQDNAAYWLVHKAKVQLLHEHIKARVEREHGKELEALADAIVVYVKEQSSETSATEDKIEKLQEQFDKLFG